MCIRDSAGSGRPDRGGCIGDPTDARGHCACDAPATGHVRGSNFVRVFARYDERTGRITTISVEDNLVKGAAGQAVQAFNIVFGLPVPTGLEQLPIVP